MRHMLLLCCCLLLTRVEQQLRAADGARETLVDPLKLNAPTLRNLEQNRKKQSAAMQSVPVVHDFSFSDEREKSGISFQHNAVEDAAKTWMPAHYDHGTGLACADVDRDGKLDLFFANQLGGNELWRNLGGGKFENITPSAGVGLPDKVCVGASFADIDNDGWTDLFVTTVRMGNVLFKNLGNGKFQDITAAAGLGYAGHSSGAVFLDFNRDGLTDLFVVNIGKYTLDQKGVGGFYRAYDLAFKGHLETERSEQSILYQNLGNGKFKDVSKELGLEHRGWSGDATSCDFNEDGFPDLYVVNMQGDNKYYENDRGQRFVEKTAAYFPKTPWGAMGVKVFDFNGDGKMDLYVTDMHSDMTEAQTKAGKSNFTTAFEKRKSEAWCTVEWSDVMLQGASNNIFGNAFYQNNGNGTFTEISDRIGAETYWPWGLSVGDLNADGFEDAFITAGMGYPFRYSANSILLNVNGQKFVDSEFVLGVEPRRDNRIQIVYFTLDCSGPDKTNSYCYHKKGTIGVLGSTSSRSSVMLDLDEDGDLDIVTNDMNDRPQVFISNLAEKRKINYLKVNLVGTISNRDGIGAVVRVQDGSKIRTQRQDGKSGYLSQSVMPLYFGLGSGSNLKTIQVDWPSGKRQEVTQNLTANRTITITEPR